MAFTTPILYDVYAFDYAKGCVFEFSYKGDQAECCEIVITNANGTKVLYRKLQQTRKSRFTIFPGDINGGTLSYGTRYKATVTIYSSYYSHNQTGGGTVATSNPIYFTCYQTPYFRSVQMSNVIAHQTIGSSVSTLTFEYSSGNNYDKLNTWRVVLYDTHNSVVQDTGNQYAKGERSFMHIVTGLMDNEQYRLVITGETANHMLVSEEVVHFSVNYTNPDQFRILTVENEAAYGHIKLASNIVSIPGKAGPMSESGKISENEPATPHYIDKLFKSSIDDASSYVDKGEIDLTHDGHWVIYDNIVPTGNADKPWINGYENFAISNDFIMQLRIRKPNYNSDVLSMYHTETPLKIIPIDDPRTDVREDDPMLTRCYDNKYIYDVMSISKDRVPCLIRNGEEYCKDEIEGYDQKLILRIHKRSVSICDSGQKYAETKPQECVYATLMVENHGMQYMQCSNYLAYKENLEHAPSLNYHAYGDALYLHIWIKRVNGLYELKIEYVAESGVWE